MHLICFWDSSLRFCLVSAVKNTYPTVFHMACYCCALALYISVCDSYNWKSDNRIPQNYAHWDLAFMWPE